MSDERLVICFTMFDALEYLMRRNVGGPPTADEIAALVDTYPATDSDIASVIERMTQLGQCAIDVANKLKTVAPVRAPPTADLATKYSEAQVRAIAKVDWRQFFDWLGADMFHGMRDGQWICFGDRAQPSHPFARGILLRAGLNDGEVQLCVDFFRQLCGYCDCEIMFNVHDHLLPPSPDDEPPDDHGPTPPQPTPPPMPADKETVPV